MSTLATRYDLRAYAGVVTNQGIYGTCMPSALTNTMDLIMRLSGHAIAPLSIMQSYADIRNAQNTFSYDSGSVPEVAFDMAMQKGIAYSKTWTYTADHLYTQPTAAVYAEASHMKISGYTPVNIYQGAGFIADDVKALLSQGKPVVLGFLVRDFFFAEHGPLETQTSFGLTLPFAGGHAVEIVGYDDNINGGSYIVKNSWGTSWGDKGYGTISYHQFEPHFPTYDSDGNYIYPDLIGMWTVNGVNDINLTYTTERVTMAQEYAIILGRAPEVAGMDWWADHLSHGDITKAALADMLLASSEALAVYSKETNAQFVDNMYQNILGRHADASGATWWTQLLDSGVSRGTLANYLMDAVSTSTTDIVARDFLANKTNLSSYISIALQYDGKHDSQVKTVMASVNSDANHTEIIKVGLAEMLHHA